MKVNESKPQTSFNVLENDFNENVLTLIEMNVTITVTRKSIITITHGYHTIEMHYHNYKSLFVIVTIENNDYNHHNNGVNSHDIIDALNEYNNGKMSIWFDMLDSFKPHGKK